MKRVNLEEIAHIAKTLKAEGKTVVFTNGCFDILHTGHVRYLAAARELGDCLVVGLNSDSSVTGLKGPSRPINCQEDRAEVLAALAAVNYVVVFSDRTADSLVENIRPDIYVKGGDYCVEDIPEAKTAAKYGGRTILIPEVVGRSSSNIIKKLDDKVESE